MVPLSGATIRSLAPAVRWRDDPEDLGGGAGDVRHAVWYGGAVLHAVADAEPVPLLVQLEQDLTLHDQDELLRVAVDDQPLLARPSWIEGQLVDLGVRQCGAGERVLATQRSVVDRHAVGEAQRCVHLALRTEQLGDGHVHRGRQRHQGVDARCHDAALDLADAARAAPAETRQLPHDNPWAMRAARSRAPGSGWAVLIAAPPCVAGGPARVERRGSGSGSPPDEVRDERAGRGGQAEAEHVVSGGDDDSFGSGDGTDERLAVRGHRPRRTRSSVHACQSIPERYGAAFRFM